MPQPEHQNLKQDAVLWPNAGFDGNGNPIRGTAVPIKVRWEESDRLITGAQAEPEAKPITVFVDRVVARFSQIWLGKLSDLPNDSANYTNLFVVTGYEAIPDLKNRHVQRTVTLMRIQ